MRSAIVSFLVLLACLFLVTTRIAAQSPITLEVLPADVSEFPKIKLIVRARDASGAAVRGLENGFRLQERTDIGSRDEFLPDSVLVSPDSGPVAVSIVLDTRSTATISELNAARDFARLIVETLREKSNAAGAEQDPIELWLPGQSGSVHIPYEQGDLVTLTNAINQALPVPESSAGLDELLRDIIDRPTPDGRPHVIILVGKIKDVQPQIDPRILADLAVANQGVIYTHPVSVDSDESFLRQLADASRGRYIPTSTTSTDAVISQIWDRFKGQYELTYTSGLTPRPDGHRLLVRAVSQAGSAQGEIDFFAATQPADDVESRISLLVLGLAVAGSLAIVCLVAAIVLSGARISSRQPAAK